MTIADQPIFKDRSILYGYTAWFREPDGHDCQTIFALDAEEAEQIARQYCQGRNIRFKEIEQEPSYVKDVREIPIAEFRAVEEFRRQWREGQSLRNAKAMSKAFDQILGTKPRAAE